MSPSSHGCYQEELPQETGKMQRMSTLFAGSTSWTFLRIPRFHGASTSLFCNFLMYFNVLYCILHLFLTAFPVAVSAQDRQFGRRYVQARLTVYPVAKAKTKATNNKRNKQIETVSREARDWPRTIGRFALALSESESFKFVKTEKLAIGFV